MTYVLHYAPDNASLIIRLALEHQGLPYRVQLVDRSTAQQTSPQYLRLNPNGLIPVLETKDGPLFETGAILVWLTDTHAGLGPQHQDKDRGDFLKWLFFMSNTLHATLRMVFYSDKYIAADHIAAFRDGLSKQLIKGYATLDDAAARNPGWLGGQNPSVADFYTCALMRWSALYPTGWNRGWFDLAHYPHLSRICAKIESEPCCAALKNAEGLGSHPFTDPRPPQPPEGSAL